MDRRAGGSATAVAAGPVGGPRGPRPDPTAARPHRRAAARKRRGRLRWPGSGSSCLRRACFWSRSWWRPSIISRYLTYTTLGAAVLLAYYATRDGSREVRLGVAGTVAVAMLLFGFWTRMSRGDGLFSSGLAQGIMGDANTPGKEGEGGLAGAP